MTVSAVTPVRCLTGACIAGTLGLLLYRLTAAIAHSFASHPVSTHNQLIYGLTVAVRTIVVGICTLGTGVFSIIGVGLVALSVQLLWQRWIQPSQD